MKRRGGKIKKQLKGLPCLLVWLCWLCTFHLFCGGEISKRIKRAILPLLILSLSLSLSLSHMGTRTFAQSLTNSFTHASHTQVQYNGMLLEIVCMQVHVYPVTASFPLGLIKRTELNIVGLQLTIIFINLPVNLRTMFLNNL